MTQLDTILQLKLGTFSGSVRNESVNNSSVLSWIQSKFSLYVTFLMDMFYTVVKSTSFQLKLRVGETRKEPLFRQISLSPLSKSKMESLSFRSN